MSKKVLITGHAGFIGSAAADDALNKGYEVCGIDAMIEGSCRANINPNVEHHEIFIEDYDNLKYVVHKFKPNIVLHFGALSNVDTSISTPLAFNSNYEATATLCQILKEENFDGTMIQVSTDEVTGSYDYAASTTFESGGFTEESRLNPTSAYAVSKAASEMIALSYFKTFQLPLRITRCSNNYGIRQQDKLIPTIFKCLHEQKKIPIFRTPARRNWLHLSDHLAAIWHVIEHGTDGEVYNISSNENYSPQEIVEIIMGEENAKTHIESVDSRLAYDLVYKINSQKLRNMGWAPQTSLKEQIPGMVDWYLNAFETGYFQ